MEVKVNRAAVGDENAIVNVGQTLLLKGCKLGEKGLENPDQQLLVSICHDNLRERERQHHCQ